MWSSEPAGPEPLLAMTDLAIRFARSRPVVDGVSVRVDPGELVALVGESGSGKSMTARAVLGLLPPGAGASGSIRILGREVLGVADHELDAVRGRQVGLVLQEPQSALNPVRRIGWQLREAIRAHHPVHRTDARRRAVELLRQVELPDPETRIDQFPHQLSGGQQQRVAIALALANEPALLIADEPTTALDVTVQAEILDLLDRLRRRNAMGVLLITHDMGIVAERADRVAVLERGHAVESGATTAVFAEPRHPYTRRMLAAVPSLSRTAGPAAARRQRPAGRPVVAFERATVAYPGRRGTVPFRALDEVTMQVRPGEVVGVVGESGSGKSTLGRIAAGLLPLSEGRVVLEGEDLARVPAARLRRLRRDLAFVHQDPAAALDPVRTVQASIREPLDIHRVGSRGAREERVRELLDAVRLPSHVADRLPHQLSGGQRQRVALARALALRPRLLVADEPTSALDVSVQAEILDLVTELQRDQGFACLFISHDLAVVQQVADRVAVLRSGRLVEEGDVHEVFTSPRHGCTRALLDAVPVPDPRARTTAAAVTPRPAPIRRRAG